MATGKGHWSWDREREIPEENGGKRKLIKQRQIINEGRKKKECIDDSKDSRRGGEKR